MLGHGHDCSVGDKQGAFSVKVVITTYPFGQCSLDVQRLLDEIRNNHEAEIVFNALCRKYSKDEVAAVLEKENPDIIIAGTETYDAMQLDLCKNLKMIARAGVGLDSIDIEECKRRKIIVTNTPDAPTNAVAELAVLQILSLLRRNHIVDRKMRENKWKRYTGRELKDCCVGVIGNGRIGSSVIKKIEAFNPKRILYTDLDPKREIFSSHTWSNKEDILRECDVITIHMPLSSNSVNYIGKEELSLVKNNAVLINTSRGGIINEKNLHQWLSSNPEASAAVDVFENEPYDGRLLELTNVLLSPHFGPCTTTSRAAMESGAVREVLNFLCGTPPTNEVSI